MQDEFKPATGYLYASEVEQKIIGACMSEQASFYLTVQHLKPEYFYDDFHKEIFQVLVDSLNEGKFADLLVLSQKLRDRKSLHLASRGMHYLVELSNNGFYLSDTLLVEHINIIREYYFRRSIVEINQKFTGLHVNGEPSMETYTEQLQEMLLLESEIKPSKQGGIETSVEQVRKQVLNAAKGIKPQNILSTGLKALDRIIVGLSPTDFILLGARPSMGKTSLALSIILFLCRLGKGVKFYSLEMSEVQIISRLVAMISGISFEYVKRGIVSEEQQEAYEKALKEISTFKLYIDDRAGLNPTMVRTSSIQDKSHGKQIDLVIVDYIQLMDVGAHAANRNVGVGIASTSLKVLAKDLNVPVIALSQLSRGLEARPDKRPILADLRDSGSLEQDADMVLFLFRAEQYGVQAYEDNRSTVGVAEINVAKNRNGELGIAIVQFQKEVTLFSNMEEAQLASYMEMEEGDNPF